MSFKLHCSFLFHFISVSESISLSLLTFDIFIIFLTVILSFLSPLHTSGNHFVNTILINKSSHSTATVSQPAQIDYDHRLIFIGSGCKGSVFSEQVTTVTIMYFMWELKLTGLDGSARRWMGCYETHLTPLPASKSVSRANF